MKTKIAVVMVALALFSCALAGCSPKAEKINTEQFVGRWEFIQGSQETLSKDKVDSAKSLGTNAFLTLEKDETGSFDMYENVKNLTWKATSETEGTLTLEDTKPTDMTVKDDELILSDSGDNTLMFKRVSSEESADAK